MSISPRLVPFALCLALFGCGHDVDGGLFSQTSQGNVVTTATPHPAGSSDDGAGSEDGSGAVGGGSSSESSGAAATTAPITTDPTNGIETGIGDTGLGDTGLGDTGDTIGPLGESSSGGPVDTGLDTGAGSGTCCTAGLSPGCSEAAIETCVCSFDDYCCSTAWDSTCVTEANDCGGACGGGGASSCCVAQLSVGCDDAVIEACVCSLDDYCCTFEWDDVCVSEAYDCGAPC